MRQLQILLAVSVLVAILVMFHSVSKEPTHKETLPEIPEGVPSDSVWKGGKDGGSFFKCEEVENALYVDCTVYNDFSGEVILSERYYIKDMMKEVSPWSIPALYSKISGSDGVSIYLEGSKPLVSTYLN